MAISTNNVEWREVRGQLLPFIGGKQATWCPQAGSQVAFLSCPIFEVLLTGNRGGGKTDALLASFANHVGKGYGIKWRGVLFRQTFPELDDVKSKSIDKFKRIWPKSDFNKAKMTWTFPDGEELLFRHMNHKDDYYNYHGHAYPWIGWEELTTWATDECYKLMMSCCRSDDPNLPRMYRATTNPYGVGHSWVKRRFQLPVPHGEIRGSVVRELDDDKNPLPLRVAINSSLSENKVLMIADPGYLQRIKAAARNPGELAAWADGSWDIVSGGMFDDCWYPKFHVVPDINVNMIPHGWRISRSYDHGQSKPFSVGWWAISNGEPVVVNYGTRFQAMIGTVRGDTIRIYEWYGCTSQANEGLRMTATEIAMGINERQANWRLGGRVKNGVADSSIFDEYEPTKSVAGDMKRAGVFWFPADKGPGSRSQGWQQMRLMLKSSMPQKGSVRESPGLFVCQRCANFIRTVPVLPRDDSNIDDVDTDAEDHIGDETRYFLRQKARIVTSGSWN
jgi:hypothetical protein